MRGGRRHHKPKLRHSLTAPAGGLDSKTKEEGDRASTSGGERRIELTLRDKIWLSRSEAQVARIVLLFETGDKGNQLEGSGNGSTHEWARRVM